MFFALQRAEYQNTVSLLYGYDIDHPVGGGGVACGRLGALLPEAGMRLYLSSSLSLGLLVNQP